MVVKKIANSAEILWKIAEKRRMTSLAGDSKHLFLPQTLSELLKFLADFPRCFIKDIIKMWKTLRVFHRFCRKKRWKKLISEIWESWEHVSRTNFKTGVSKLLLSCGTSFNERRGGGGRRERNEERRRKGRSSRELIFEGEWDAIIMCNEDFALWVSRLEVMLTYWLVCRSVGW